MAVVNIVGFETGDTSEFYSYNGSPTVQSAVKRTGSYAGRCNATGGAACAIGIAKYDSLFSAAQTYMSVATLYTRFHFRATALPASGVEEIFRAAQPALKFALRITSTGYLQAFDSDGNKLGSDGTTQLSAGRWYRIEVKVGTGASAAYEVKINGTSELSGTGDLDGVNNYVIWLGKVASSGAGEIDFYYDDIAMDDAAYPGPGGVTVMTASADGYYTSFTIGAGSGDKWEQLTDIPQDGDTSYLLSTLTSGQAYTAAMESCASAGISGDIFGAKELVCVNGHETSSGSFRVRLRSGSTDSTNFDNIPSAVGSYFYRGRVYGTDPATSAAWTTSGLDGAEVGIVEYSTTRYTRLTAAYLMVDWAKADDAPPAPGAALSVQISPENIDHYTVGVDVE